MARWSNLPPESISKLARSLELLGHSHGRPRGESPSSHCSYAPCSDAACKAVEDVVNYMADASEDSQGQAPPKGAPRECKAKLGSSSYPDYEGA